MDIFLIFASEQDTEASWLVDSWDEYTIDGNYEGYLAAVKKARAEHDIISIVKTSIDDDAVLASFQPTEIPLTGPK